MKQPMEIKTSAGTIVVYENANPDAPGVSVALRPDGEMVEFDLAYIEVKENAAYRDEEDYADPEDVYVYMYGDPYTDEYTDRAIIRRKDILKAMEE